MALSDRLVVLDQGRVISEGDPEQVMSDPAVVTAYLGDRSKRA
jgi:branched-chain amino acid transport system ATP-binding protein